jgi:hypothetical protein
MTVRIPTFVSRADLLKFGLIALVAAAGASGLVVLRNSNTRLRKQVADLRIQNNEVALLREDNQRTRKWLALAEASGDDTVARIHAEWVRTQSELSALEKRAEKQHAQRRLRDAARAAKYSMNTSELAGNRDPEQGLTRLEYFRNMGRATPGAAFQTVVWAALKGDDATLGSALAISDHARAEAGKLIATLPENIRAQYPTPDRLMALFVAGAILEHATAAQIVGQTNDDARHATVSIGVAGAVADTNVQFQLGADGWQLVVPESVMAQVKKKLAEDARPPPAS